ncbi:precorrin-3B synthase [Azospirillum agricola]|uniref:precorrin-3B synthase n=1 Tax=Azospirillum agricola TaxID=1720247 RepID=UPI001AE5C6DE|nr:precorrin-3B synthase [Azospirillum agricola]MBP2232065.1 precorrin-3B synthase [Azospirillum agricola]
MTSTVRSTVPTPVSPRNPPRRRGTCPGVLAPMEVGDGFLLRVRVPAGVLPAEHARRIAALGAEHGNGLIDLSHRGNLQLRGVPARGLEPVTDALRAMGYVADDAVSEAVRNVLCAPAAGLDGTAPMDARPVARALDARLAGDAALHRLPPKFGWLVCGGGIAHLASSGTDVRFDAVDGERLRVSLGGTLAEAVPLGLCRAEEVADVASALGRAFLELRATLPEPPRRMAGLVAAVGVEPFRARLSPLLLPLPPGERVGVRGTHLMEIFGCAEPPHPDLLPGGKKEHDAWLTVAFPFGRLTCAALSALSDLTHEIRLTPWRALLLVRPAPEAAAQAAALGAILTPADRRLKLTACSGLRGCDVGTTDTHTTALAIADRAGPLLDRVRMVHVSGCAKGCAHPGAADVTLTARDGVYDVALNAKPGAASRHAGLSPDDAVACVAGLSPEELPGA